MISDNAERYDSHQAFLHNARIFLPNLQQDFKACFALISEQIATDFQTIITIELLVAQSQPLCTKSKLYIRLLDANQEELLLVISPKLARKLLAKKLGSTLIDDSHAELFSSTENGIFSFIMAELLWQLSKTNLPLPKKLLDISTDYKPLSTKTSMLQFFIVLDHQTFLAELILPKKLLAFTRPTYSQKTFMSRLGHLKQDLRFNLKTLSLSLSTVSELSFGDLIMFDSSNIKFEKNLYGPMATSWHELSLSGSLVVKDQGYQFCIENFASFKEDDMEIVSEIFTSAAPTDKVVSITESIRINVSIELARLSLTLKDVASLKEGELIDLKRNISDPLALVIEGKIIGYCQPVQIDGRLGVRILEIGES